MRRPGGARAAPHTEQGDHHNTEETDMHPNRIVEHCLHRWTRLRERDERGAETTEWILIVVGALIIGGAVLMAIQGFVDAQIAKLPG